MNRTQQRLPLSGNVVTPRRGRTLVSIQNFRGIDVRQSGGEAVGEIAASR